MSKYRDAIREAREQERADRLMWERDRIEFETEYLAKQKRKRAFLDAHTRPATLYDYKDWLKGHLENGGKITHYYEHSFYNHNFYVLLSNAEILPFYGSQSFQIIVPVGLTLTGDSGHSSLYWMDGFKTRDGYIPAFNDM